MEVSVHACSFFSILIFLFIQLHNYVEANEFEDCRSSSSCGNVSLSYPFYNQDRRPEHCGYPGFEVQCNDGDHFPEISVTTTSSVRFYLLQMDPDSQTISVAREDLWNTFCPENLYNTTLNSNLYNYAPTVENVTLYYNCPTNQYLNPSYQFNCTNRNLPGFFNPNPYNSLNIPPNICATNIFVPVNESAAERVRDPASLQRALQNGFDLEWIADNRLCNECRALGGICGYNTDEGRFTCYHAADSNQRLKITWIIVACSVVGSAVTAAAVLCLRRKKLGSHHLITLSRKNKDVDAVLKRYGKLAPKRYTYGEIKQITSHFKEKLGEGGYGGVYKGRLQNGSPVAVKLLKNPDSNGTEFTNEVASISETNHVNVVTLLGYCVQGRKRALVYEFMPNGSLDKYIYSESIQNPLSWETLYKIAIGIGRGLEYLHQGCRTRILHFDIKPHNILLDAKFCPKVSDFGLAKPWLQTKSLMTMSGTRGTPGYIAPEVFCRGFGGASHKSDVYSYGMLVLDLVGCRKRNVAESENTSSELYFPHWIYKQFELNEDHELLGISNDEEKVLQRKMVIVSLWCIQMNPSDRPSISRAMEMLEEDLESLQIPPMPTLSSPPKTSPQKTSTSTMSL